MLEELARIADIYKRNLRKSLHPAIANALKVLLWSNDRTDDWTVDLSQHPRSMARSGSLRR